MILITERPSLNKIKMFFCNGDCSSFISNLKTNRSIPNDDINVYKVTDGTKFIYDAYNYYIENNKIFITRKERVAVTKSRYLNWLYMSESTRNENYSSSEVDKINYLINKYSFGTLEAMFYGKIPFPSDFSVFNGVYTNIPPKPVEYIEYESIDILVQIINVEAL